MCGIAGYLNLDGKPASRTLVREMTNLIQHRGPDGEGAYVDGRVALGHRRLSIIDLSDAASQPMQSLTGRHVLTYNGEIYNFKEIRLELKSRGYQFHSSGDSEVLLNAFEEWGIDSFIKFNGMFAFAIWDTKKRVLTLCRDRFGVKPLYYTRAGNAFLFASENKAFRAIPEFQSKMDIAGLTEYLTFQNFMSDSTLLDGVKTLAAGHYIQISQQKGIEHPKQYWDFHFNEKKNQYSEAEAVEKLDFLFEQAVNRQLMSDVPLGSYLSGGMDSGSITAIAAKQLKDMMTFTVGFDLSSAQGIELGFDERAKAESMSNHFKTEHYEMILKAGDMERSFAKLVWHLEEPRVGQSYPNFYAAKLASKFVKVVLSGAGGDELFAGYPWRYYRAVVNDDFDHYIEKYYGFWQRMLTQDQISNVLAPVWGEARNVDTLEIFKNVFGRHANKFRRPEDYINHSLYFEAKTFLNGLLIVDDKLSMAHGLEGRVPFLDNDLVDFAMHLPVSMKLRNLNEVVKLNENEAGSSKTSKYFQKTGDGKLILRTMMAKHIPAEIVEREKQGFSAPDASWFKGESIEFVRRKLLNSNAKIYDFLDKKSVEKLLNEHLSGQENRRLLIWSLLYLEQFSETFL